MAYLGISANLGVHVCFPYFQQLKKCSEGRALRAYSCREQQQDYLQCHRKTKLNEFVRFAERERRLHNVAYDVPYYDQENDQFVYDSGKKISNSDPIFKKFKWL